MKDKVTICIPVYNSLNTIKIILSSLNYQDIYPKILILDNGSKDGTFAALNSILFNRWFPDLDIDLIYFGKSHKARENKNIEAVRHEFTKRVNTEYLMFLDSDVLIPPYSIKPMLELMEKDKKIGMLGLKYDVNASHIKMGATILRTNLAKEIKWRYDEEACDCLNCAKDLLVRGFKVEHYDKTQARHLIAF